MHLKYISAATQEAIVSAQGEAYMHAAAIAAAFAVPVPLSVLPDIKTYAEGGVDQAIAQVVGVFNEVCPFSTSKCISFALRVWQARYEVAHGLLLEKVGACADGGVLDLFGIGFCLTASETEAITANACEIMKVLGPCIKAARQITAVPA